MEKMERRRTLTMTWDGLADVDDDDDRFFETFDRISTAVPLDLASSDDDDDEDFEDSRMSFVSTVSSATHLHKHTTKKEYQNFARSAPGSMSPDYDVWMLAPGSITERRKRLFQDMGLSRDRELLSFKVDDNNVNNNNNTNSHHEAPASVSKNKNNNNNCNIKESEETKRHNSNLNPITQSHSESPVKRENSPTQENSPETTVVLVRSRSDGDIESLCIDKKRKEEMIGLISKQRLTRTSSMMLLQHAKVCPYQESVRVASKDSSGNSVRSVRRSENFASILSSSRLGAFFLIKNLDTGKEFIVNEYSENGMWNKLSDLQTGKQLTMEEFEKSVGHSPVVKELMRRENVNRINDSARKFSANSYLSKSLRMSKRRGAALLKNIKGVAHSMSVKGDKECINPNPLLGHQREQKEQKQNKNVSNKWVKVRQSGKSYKDLSALHLCQEIQAHEGSIWTIKFSLDARFLASAGEDRVIHVWEVLECEVMSMSEGNLTPIHPSLCNSSDKASSLDGSSPNPPPEKKKKGKHSSPDYVHVPETVFSLSDKPFCSFIGHLDDVLDLSWSRSHLLLSSSMDKTVRLWDMETKSCLKLFAHNDYVTCIQFNPMDDDYFISGSLDAKVRIWSISDRLVVDWTDLHEMVTAACYTPDGQNALIGSHKGSCRLYSIEDGKLHQLNQVDFQTKKKSSTRKITGFQFSPSNPSEVLVTSADSRIRILDGLDIVHKFRGFRNTSSQISAAFNADGKYIISASEDSQVYVWKREEHRNASTGKRAIITTRNHEHFQCKDVSVAIPWPGMVKGEPPPTPVQTKKHAKRISSNPTSATSSPTKEGSPAGHSRRLLPPLPKKTNKVERVPSPPEEELSLISHDPGIGESFTSNSSSIRSGDSPSIATASETNSNSYSLRQDDPASISSSTDRNSSSFTNWSSWFDVGSHSSHTVQATAWGLVIVTATLGGEIKTYQNFGIPRRLGRL